MGAGGTWRAVYLKRVLMTFTGVQAEIGVEFGREKVRSQLAKHCW